MEIIDEYLINTQTMAILPVADERYDAKVIEVDREFLVSELPFRLIKEGCLKGGASYDGRRQAVSHLFNFSQKSPIPIQPSVDIYAFPTTSPLRYECCWIFYNHIDGIDQEENTSIITFKNGQTLELDVSYYTLQKQCQRTAFCIVHFSMLNETNRALRERGRGFHDHY